MPLVVLILGLSKEKSVQNGNFELTAEFERIPSALFAIYHDANTYYIQLLIASEYLL